MTLLTQPGPLHRHVDYETGHILYADPAKFRRRFKNPHNNQSDTTRNVATSVNDAVRSPPRWPSAGKVYPDSGSYPDRYDHQAQP